ncbi:hypothetical protein TKK_0016147 [Trichogramma kaykai]
MNIDVDIDSVLMETDDNNKTNDQSLIEHGLEAFVPGFRKTRKGIVKGIDVEFNDVELLEGIKCPEFTKVVEVRRINRKEKVMPNASNTNEEENTQVKWIPTKSVVLSFEGQTLPDYISVWGVRVKVEPYRVSQKPTCINSKNSTPSYKDIVVDSGFGSSKTPASAYTSTSVSTFTLTSASPPGTFKTKINNNCTHQAKENNS